MKQRTENGSFFEESPSFSEIKKIGGIMEERLLAILRLALRLNATDIHFTIRGSEIEIQMRVDDSLRKVKSAFQDEKLIRYLQYLANLDVGNILTPQTGQFEIEVDGILLSLRFAVINNYHFTNAVLRILNTELQIDADHLSHIESQNRYFKALLRHPYGLVLFSGPTGSGKTTSLYSLLDSVRDLKIFTIEDPVEVYNDHFIQLQVNEAQRFDYSAGIRQILRHDPDIIMIGEIRDEKAAQMAVTAANTGHLVLSTIHASSASSCVSRMRELGVSEESLYEVLLCLSNQRMMIEKGSGRKHVLYEIMDRREIDHFRRYKRNSEGFYSIGKQIERGVENGLFAQEE